MSGMMVTNPFSSAAATFFQSGVVPTPVVHLVNNANAFSLDIDSFSEALTSGSTYVDEWNDSERYNVRMQPAMWAWATVDEANAKKPERVRTGARLLMRELSPLEYDYTLESSVVFTGDRIMVGAMEYRRMADALEYIERWRDTLKVLDLLPRAFEPHRMDEGGFSNGGGYLQHIPRDLDIFREEYRKMLSRHLGAEGVRYFLGGRYGPRSERSQNAHPLGIPAMRLKGIDSMLREWSPATWRGGKSRARRVEREWPYVIRGGYLYVGFEKIMSAERLHSIL